MATQIRQVLHVRVSLRKKKMMEPANSGPTTARAVVVFYRVTSERGHGWLKASPRPWNSIVIRCPGPLAMQHGSAELMAANIYKSSQNQQEIS
jgi:hypothetical protein